MSQCHCEVTNLACNICCLWLKIFILILYLQIDKDNQKSGDVFIIFTFFYYFLFSLFFFSSSFNSLTSQNFYPDFHQAVVLIKYFYLHQKVMFLCVHLSICLSVFFFFFFLGGGGGGGWLNTGY